MKIKSAIKYHLYDCRMSLLIFYSVMVALTILVAIIAHATNIHGSIGIEFSSACFLFVFAILSFRTTFKFYLQNGVSRRSLFLAQQFSFVLLALFTLLSNSILFVIHSKLGLLSVGNSFQALMYGQAGRYHDGFFGTYFQDSLITTFAASLTLLALGSCVSIVFYRLSKLGRLLVACALGFLVIGLPVIDVALWQGRFLSWFFRGLSFFLGIQDNNPLIFLASAVGFFLLLGTANYFLTRRVEPLD